MMIEELLYREIGKRIKTYREQKKWTQEEDLPIVFIVQELLLPISNKESSAFKSIPYMELRILWVLPL